MACTYVQHEHVQSSARATHVAAQVQRSVPTASRPTTPPEGLLAKRRLSATLRRGTVRPARQHEFATRDANGATITCERVETVDWQTVGCAVLCTPVGSPGDRAAGVHSELHP